MQEKHEEHAEMVRKASWEKSSRWSSVTFVVVLSSRSVAIGVRPMVLEAHRSLIRARGS